MIVQLEEIRNELFKIKDDLLSLRETLSIDKSKIKLQELEAKTAKPDFWNDTENSQKILSEISKLSGKIKEFEKLKQLSDEFLKQEENNELVEEANEEEEEIVIEPK